MKRRMTMNLIGIYIGPVPVILRSRRLDDFLLHMIGNEDGKVIEFGAHQVIVVRDEESKKRLPEQLRHFLLMTPVEIKGLEFEDVLVWNFFGDSPSTANWHALSEKRSSEQEGEKMSNKHVFDAERDQILCSELKTLYMVCTRAKNNLWFLEEKPERAQAMEERWKQKNVVMVSTNYEFMKERGSMTKRSTKQAWREQGLAMLDKKLYGHAAVCFDKSGDVEYKNKSEACLLATEASKEEGTGAREKWIMAADKFRSTGELKQAAQCFFSAREYYHAFRLFRECGMEEESEKCAKKVTNWVAMAQLEMKREGEGRRKEAMECYERGRAWKEGLTFMMAHSEEMRGTKEGKRFMEQCKAYVRGLKDKEMEKQYNEAMKVMDRRV